MRGGICMRPSMGQAPSSSRHQKTPRVTAAGSEEPETDPFHRSPISPRLATYSQPFTNDQPASINSVPYPPIGKKPSLSVIQPTSYPAQPKPSISSRVVRKLSKSARHGTPLVDPRGLGKKDEDVESRLQGFEQLVESMESGQHRRQSPPSGSVSVQVTPSSIGSSNLSGPSLTIITPTGSRPNLSSATFKDDLPRTPLPTRPAHLRRGSSTSSSRSQALQPHSPRARSRAEREWRARVAAISAGAKIGRSGSGSGTPTTGGKGGSPAYKGPVPPRRRPQQSLSTAPFPVQSHSLPPHLLIQPDPASPSGKSFVSNKSFETLGHHATLQPTLGHQAQYIPLETPLRPRSRKASVPRSVSSFYFEPSSRSDTRPNSLAASTFFSPGRSPLRYQGVEIDVDVGDQGPEVDDEVGNLGGGGCVEGEKEAVLKEDDQASEEEAGLFTGGIQFDVDLAQPSTALSSPPLPHGFSSSDRAEPPQTPARHLPDRTSSLPRTATTSRRYSDDTPAKTPRSQTKQDRILSLPAIDITPTRTLVRPLPSIPTSPAPTSNLPQTVQLSPTPSPPSLSFALSTPTPTRLLVLDSPQTPCSPMTAYILSAPSIDLTFPVYDDELPSNKFGYTDGPAIHPFASFLDAPSPPRHTSLQSMAKVRPIDLKYKPREGIQSTAARPRHVAPVPVKRPLRSRTPNGLPTARDAILGAAEKQERTKGQVKLELCPGMDGGVRPPKRGMDMTDLERWLAGTAI